VIDLKDEKEKLMANSISGVAEEQPKG